MRSFTLVVCLGVAITLPGSLGFWDEGEKPNQGFLEKQEELVGVGLSEAEITTYETTVPAGHDLQVTLTRDGLDMSALPPGGIQTNDQPQDAVGCVAAPGVASEGWAPSPFGACEPDVEKRAWHHSPIERLVFSTNGEDMGSVNAVNAPSDPARHGVFVLWCSLTGTAVLDVNQFFHYTEATCSLIEAGTPLWEYDEWTSHVGAPGTDVIDPTQVYSVAVWE